MRKVKNYSADVDVANRRLTIEDTDKGIKKVFRLGKCPVDFAFLIYKKIVLSCGGAEYLKDFIENDQDNLIYFFMDRVFTYTESCAII